MKKAHLRILAAAAPAALLAAALACPAATTGRWTGSSGHPTNNALWMYQPHAVPSLSDFAGPDGAFLPRHSGTEDLTDDLNWALGNTGGPARKYIFLKPGSYKVQNPIRINTHQDLYLQGSNQYDTRLTGTNPCGALFTVSEAHVLNVTGLDFLGTSRQDVTNWYRAEAADAGGSCVDYGFLDDGGPGTQCSRVPPAEPARCPGAPPTTEPPTGAGMVEYDSFYDSDGGLNLRHLYPAALNQKMFDFQNPEPILFELLDCMFGGLYFDANGPGYYRLQNFNGTAGLAETDVAVSNDQADVLVVGGGMCGSATNVSTVLEPGYRKGYAFWQKRGRLRVYGNAPALIHAEADIRIDRAAPKLGPEPGPHVLAAIRSEGQDNGRYLNIGLSKDPLNPDLTFGTFLRVPPSNDRDIVSSGGRTSAEEQVDVLVEDSMIAYGAFSWTNDRRWTSNDATHPRCALRGNGSCVPPPDRFPDYPVAAMTRLPGLSRQLPVCYCPTQNNDKGLNPPASTGPWPLTAGPAATVADYNASGHVWIIDTSNSWVVGQLAISSAGTGRASQIVALGNMVNRRNVSELVATGTGNVVSDNAYRRFDQPWYCQTTADGGLCPRDDAGIPYDPTASSSFFHQETAFTEDMVDEHTVPASFPAVPSASLPPPLRLPVADLLDSSRGPTPDGGATPEAFGFVNVKNLDAGVRGDGVTDDTKALNAALHGHAHVYIPAGTYCVSAPVNWINETLGGWLAGAGSCDVTKDGEHCPAQSTILRGDCPDVETPASHVTVFFVNKLWNSVIQGITFRTAAYDPSQPEQDAGWSPPLSGTPAPYPYRSVVQLECDGCAANALDDVVFRGGLNGLGAGSNSNEELVMVTNAVFADSKVGFDSNGWNELGQQLYGTRFVNNDLTISTGPAQTGLAVYDTTVRGTRVLEFKGSAYLNGFDSDTQIVVPSGPMNLYYENAHLRKPTSSLQLWKGDYSLPGTPLTYADDSFAQFFNTHWVWSGNILWFPPGVASTKFNFQFSSPLGGIIFLNSTVDSLSATFPENFPESILQLGSHITSTTAAVDPVGPDGIFSGVGAPQAQRGDAGCTFISDKSSPYYMDATCWAHRNCPCQTLHLPVCLESCPFSPRLAVAPKRPAPDGGAPDDWGGVNEFHYSAAKWLIEETDGGVATSLCNIYEGVPEGEAGFTMSPLQARCHQ